MARWTGTWLSGLGAAGVELIPKGSWRGRRLGLPPEGPGAVATPGSRLAAFLVDILVAGLIGGLVNAVVLDPTSDQRAIAGNAAFAAEVLVLTALTGQSIGMRLLGIRVLRLGSTDGPPGVLPAAIRTALLMLVLPAVLMDRDGRGLHDKAARTVVVRTRSARSFAVPDAPPER